MWNVNGKPVSGAWLDPEPVRVLYDFDGPRIFICEDTKGDPFLAYQCGEEADVWRYLVVPFGPGLELALTSGEINLRDAITRPRAWVFDLGADWQPKRVWKVDVDELPPSVLPRPGVMLWRHLTPVMKRWSLRPGATETETITPQFGSLHTSWSLSHA